MDLRTLESLREAIPVLLRHIDAYVELAEQDFAQAKSATASRVRVAALFGISALFTVLMLCALVVGLTWNTEYRIAALSVLTLLFGGLAIWAAMALTRKREAPFASLRREWKEDRELIRDFLTRGSNPTANTPSEFAQQRGGESVWLHR